MFNFLSQLRALGDSESIQFGVVSSAAVASMVLVRPVRRSAAEKVAYRVGNAALAAFMLSAWPRDVRQDSLNPLMRIGIAAGAAALGYRFAESGAAIDDRLENELRRLGFRHPRIVMAMGSAGLSAATFVLERHAGNAKRRKEQDGGMAEPVIHALRTDPHVSVPLTNTQGSGTSVIDTPPLTSRTYILTRLVRDPRDLAKNPGRYLLDIYEHEAKAARLWKKQRKKDPYWEDGFVSLNYQGKELIDPSMWDEIDTLWAYLLNLVEDFQTTGYGETGFPDQDVPILLEQEGDATYLTIDELRVTVEPALFIPGIVTEAERFLLWSSKNLDEDVTSEMQQIATIRERLKEQAATDSPR